MVPETRTRTVQESVWIPPTTAVLTIYHKFPEILESEPEVQIVP
jgi:hypothetical protein